LPEEIFHFSPFQIRVRTRVGGAVCEIPQHPYGPSRSCHLELIHGSTRHTWHPTLPWARSSPYLQPVLTSALQTWRAQMMGETHPSDQARPARPEERFLLHRCHLPRLHQVNRLSIQLLSGPSSTRGDRMIPTVARGRSHLTMADLRVAPL
jgi:hypothetical protein